MEPTDLYNKSKRNLAVFTAFLALVLLGSVAPEENAKILGFKLNPTAVPAVLFFVVFYLLWQFALARYFLKDEVRARLLIKIDFGVLATAAGVALVYYIWTYRYQLIGEREQLLLLVILAALAATLTFALYRSTELLKWRREAQALRQRTLADRLREPGWMLHYNPASDKAMKAITFEEDGSIGQGRNGNEHRWSLQGDTLTITRESGALQNRFQYIPSIDQFKSIPDPQAKGTRDQTIYRAGE